MPRSLGWREMLDCAGECGYDFVEISIDETDARLARLDWTREQRLELVGIMKEVGVPIRTMCLSAHRKYPFGASDPAVRARSIRDGEHRRADHVPVMDKPAVLGVVGVALGAEADDGGVLLIGNDAHNAVRRHGVFVQHKGDGLTLCYAEGVNLFDIDQRACVIRRLYKNAVFDTNRKSLLRHISAEKGLK